MSAGSARTRVGLAVQYGALPAARTLRCWECGMPAAEYHHYAGYEYEHAFDVHPLCRPCHIATHRADRTARKAKKREERAAQPLAPPVMLTVTQVARYMQVTAETVRRWLRAGQLQAIRLGTARGDYRIARAELARFLAERGGTAPDGS